MRPINAALVLITLTAWGAARIHGRRQLLWIEVTRHPTAEWLARQITEAFPWTSAPAYLVRDNDGAYGHVFTSRLRAMGIRDRPISPGSRLAKNSFSAGPYAAPRLPGSAASMCLFNAKRSRSPRSDSDVARLIE